MANRLAIYHKVYALADEPTPFRRLVAATVAGAFAFVIAQLLLGVLGDGARARFCFLPSDLLWQRHWRLDDEARYGCGLRNTRDCLAAARKLGFGTRLRRSSIRLMSDKGR